MSQSYLSHEFESGTHFTSRLIRAYWGRNPYRHQPKSKLYVAFRRILIYKGTITPQKVTLDSSSKYQKLWVIAVLCTILSQQCPTFLDHFMASLFPQYFPWCREPAAVEYQSSCQCSSIACKPGPTTTTTTRTTTTQYTGKESTKTLSCRHMGVSKNNGTPKSSLIFNRVFHYFHHPFFRWF